MPRYEPFRGRTELVQFAARASIATTRCDSGERSRRAIDGHSPRRNSTSRRDGTRRPTRCMSRAEWLTPAATKAEHRRVALEPRG